MHFIFPGFKLSIHLITVSGKEWTNAHAAINTLSTFVFPTANVLTMNQACVCVDTAWAKIEHVTEYLGAIEVELDIKT